MGVILDFLVYNSVEISLQYTDSVKFFYLHSKFGSQLILHLFVEVNVKPLQRHLPMLYRSFLKVLLIFLHFEITSIASLVSFKV